LPNSGIFGRSDGAGTAHAFGHNAILICRHEQIWRRTAKNGANWRTWNPAIVAAEVARVIVLLLALVVAFSRPGQPSARLAALIFAMSIPGGESTAASPARTEVRKLPITASGVMQACRNLTDVGNRGIIAYGLVPLGFIPIAAGMIANPRANRFVECVFTAPVNRRDWLAAKCLVLVTLAAAYYVALVPMMLVYTWHVGLPPLLQKFMIWTPGLLIESIAVGTLIGVLFIGRSLAAPAGTGMGVLLAYAGLIPLQELMVAQGNGATRTGHLTLASPAVLLKNALGFTLAASSIPATTRLTWISLLVIVIGALALAAWVFLRAQGVETWEATRRQRWTITLANRRDDCASSDVRGHELRQSRATREQRTSHPGALLPRRNQRGLGPTGRPTPTPLLQHDPQPG